MSTIARSVYFYSFYLFLMGLGMMAIPNTLLSVFGFAHTTEIWIRMLGVFTFATGIYYFHSAKTEQKEFFKATIIGRIFFFIMTVVLVFLFKQNPMLVLIGSMDLFGALWTYVTFKKQ